MRPRKPFGNPPGRLPATMIKVLAAELSDQGRLARGKRYWADQAVTDIVVGHGSVTAEIQGSRREPYVVTVEAEPGSGVPNKREVWVWCTCPDDSGTGREACKHAVAALFALSDEVAIEPDLLDRWRGGGRRRSDASSTTVAPPAAPPAGPPAAPPASVPSMPDPAAAVRPSNVVPLHRDRRVVDDAPPRRDDQADEIGRLLAAPDGAGVPEFPEVGPLEHRVADPLLREVLSDVLHHLYIDLD